MQLLIISVLIVNSLAAPQGYVYTPPEKIPQLEDDIYTISSIPDNVINRYSDSTSTSTSFGITCDEGEILNSDGKCAVPVIKQKIYSYTAPERVYDYGPSPDVPKPKLNYNVVFVRTPDRPKPQDPIIVPPAQQQSVVYVLTKDQKAQPPKVIQFADKSVDPQVYYINYKEGQNTELPGGIDLNTALSSANSKQGQFINEVDTITITRADASDSPSIVTEDDDIVINPIYTK